MVMIGLGRVCWWGDDEGTTKGHHREAACAAPRSSGGEDTAQQLLGYYKGSCSCWQRKRGTTCTMPPPHVWRQRDSGRFQPLQLQLRAVPVAYPSCVHVQAPAGSLQTRSNVECTSRPCRNGGPGGPVPWPAAARAGLSTHSGCCSSCSAVQLSPCPRPLDDCSCSCCCSCTSYQLASVCNYSSLRRRIHSYLRSRPCRCSCVWTCVSKLQTSVAGRQPSWAAGPDSPAAAAQAAPIS